MITVAIAEVFYFVEFNPLSTYTGGENGLPGIPTPSLSLGFTTIHFNTDWSLYAFLAFWYFVGIAIALRIMRSPVGAIFSAIRDNPLRAAAVGHNIHSYKLTAFVIAAAYAGFACRRPAWRVARLHAAGRLHLRHLGPARDADRNGWRRHPVRTAGRCHSLALSKRLLPDDASPGATWKLVLGVVFVLLVCFLRRGIVGGLADMVRLVTEGGKHHEAAKSDPSVVAPPVAAAAAENAPVVSLIGRSQHGEAKVILKAEGLTKRYGGLVANDSIDFSVQRGERRGIIGPNGAGKSTFFKMLTCEIPPTAGRIVFEGRDITSLGVTNVCQLGLTKSYQVNQLFTRLTVRENLAVAALAEKRGPFRLDILRHAESVDGLADRVAQTLALVHLAERAELPVSDLAYGEKRQLEIGLALATNPSLLLLDEPLAGMSARERLETVQLLKSISRGRTLVVVDHDMDAIFELAERITVLHEGRVLTEGTPEEIKQNNTVQEAYLGGVAAA